MATSLAIDGWIELLVWSHSIILILPLMLIYSCESSEGGVKSCFAVPQRPSKSKYHSLKKMKAVLATASSSLDRKTTGKSAL